jgi:hypothetical protein
LAGWRVWFQGFETFRQCGVIDFHQPRLDHADRPDDRSFGFREAGFELTELAAVRLRIDFGLFEIA